MRILTHNSLLYMPTYSVEICAYTSHTIAYYTSLQTHNNVLQAHLCSPTECYIHTMHPCTCIFYHINILDSHLSQTFSCVCVCVCVFVCVCFVILYCVCVCLMNRKNVFAMCVIQQIIYVCVQGCEKCHPSQKCCT